MHHLLRPLGVDPDRVTHALSHGAKRALVDTALRALGATFELVSERSPELQAEIAGWEAGRVLGLGVLPGGPAISLRKEAGQPGAIRYLGTGLGDPTISILFKNLDAAVLTFTGQIGTHTASIEHRVIVHGNIGHAMQAVRAMNTVQRYLMPALLLNQTAKRPVRLSAAELQVKAQVLAGLVPRMVGTWTRVASAGA
jgi:hypothetical protein